MLLGRQLLVRRLLAGRRAPHRAQDAGQAARPLSRPLRAAGNNGGDSAVPEVGWMWQPNAGAANKAGATRANLKQANIKAKK